MMGYVQSHARDAANPNNPQFSNERVEFPNFNTASP